MRTGIYGNVVGQPGTLAYPVKSARSGNAAYASGGTSSYPVTGFPSSAYLGNNRRIGGQYQTSPSAISSTLGNIQQISSRHLVITLVVIVLIGYVIWHWDNKR